MDLLLNLMTRVQAIGSELFLWQRSTQMCSREAHELMYALMFGWLMQGIFSIWLYRRINHPKPKKGVPSPAVANQESLAPTGTSL